MSEIGVVATLSWAAKDGSEMSVDVAFRCRKSTPDEVRHRVENMAHDMAHMAHFQPKVGAPYFYVDRIYYIYPMAHLAQPEVDVQTEGALMAQPPSGFAPNPAFLAGRDSAHAGGGKRDQRQHQERQAKAAKPDTFTHTADHVIVRHLSELRAAVAEVSKAIARLDAELAPVIARQRQIEDGLRSTYDWAGVTTRDGTRGTVVDARSIFAQSGRLARRKMHEDLMALSISNGPLRNERRDMVQHQKAMQNEIAAAETTLRTRRTKEKSNG